MIDAIAFIGGVGLFLAAIKLLARLPTKVDKRQMRLLAVRATAHPWRSALAGSLAGATLQSTSGVTLILAGFVAAFAIEPQAAMGLIVWANVGSSALAFLASFSLQPIVLLFAVLCALATFCLRDARSAIHIALEAALYAAIMLLALSVMRDSTYAAKDAVVVAAVAALAHASISNALLIGFVSALLTQSSSMATIMTLTAVQAGLVTIEDGVMITLGANGASAINVLVLGADLKGGERQLVLFQAAAKTIGTVATLPPFLIDRWQPSLGIGRTIQAAIGDPGTEISAVFFLCQLASLSAFYGGRRYITSVMARLAPPIALESSAPLSTV